MFQRAVVTPRVVRCACVVMAKRCVSELRDLADRAAKPFSGRAGRVTPQAPSSRSAISAARLVTLSRQRPVDTIRA